MDTGFEYTQAEVGYDQNKWQTCFGQLRGGGCNLRDDGLGVWWGKWENGSDHNVSTECDTSTRDQNTRLLRVSIQNLPEQPVKARLMHAPELSRQLMEQLEVACYRFLIHRDRIKY